VIIQVRGLPPIDIIFLRGSFTQKLSVGKMDPKGKMVMTVVAQASVIPIIGVGAAIVYDTYQEANWKYIGKSIMYATGK
jgi:hypothetical protein